MSRLMEKFIEAFDPEGDERAQRNARHAFLPYTYRVSHTGQPEVVTAAFKEGFEEAKALIEAYENSEPVDVGPFNGDLTKAEMIAHLRDVHGIENIHGYRLTENIKMTKDELVEHHADAHESLDGSGVFVVRSGERRGDDGAREPYIMLLTVGGFPLPALRHAHGVPVLDGEQQKVLSAVRKNQKVSGSTLSVQDRKVLKELVDNDFGSLKQEMRAFVADALSAKKAEINADWDDKMKAIPDFASEATDLHRKQNDETRALRARWEAEMTALAAKYEDAMKKIVEKADAKGIGLSETSEKYVDPQTGRHLARTVFKAEVKGRKEALAAVEKEHDTMLDRALMTLEKQRLTAQRQVLLSGVPDVALPIVEAIPDARSLMVKAQEDGSLKQISSTS